MISGLTKFSNIHRGSIGFVLGSGYSLKEFCSNNILSRGVVIACNGSVNCIEKADYFFMTDEAVPKQFYFDKALKISNTIIYANLDFSYHNDLLNQDNSFIFDRRYDDRENRKFDLSDSRLICGISCVHPAAHFAHILGLNPIILIGCDCDTKNGDHCYNDDVKWRQSDLDGILMEWVKISEQNKDVNILNGSLGKLNIFPRIDLTNWK